jgi:hypothetical protein
MHTRTLKSDLQIAALMFGLGAAATLNWSFLWPCAVVTDPNAAVAKTEQKPIPKAPTTEKITQKQFEAVCQKSLRHPLFDPPPKTAVVQTVAIEKKPLPNVKLVGVAVESDHSLAMFVTARGSFEIKAVGDILGDNANDPQIVSIESQQVTLKYQGDTYRVVLEGEKGRADR